MNNKQVAVEKQTGDLTDEQAWKIAVELFGTIQYVSRDKEYVEIANAADAGEFARAAIATHLAKETKAEQPLWDDNGEPLNEAAERNDRAYLAGKAAAQKAQHKAVPEGWKLVPVAPNAEMLKAGAESEDKDFGLIIHNIYCAMIKAAPALAQEAAKEAEQGSVQEIYVDQSAIDELARDRFGSVCTDIYKSNAQGRVCLATPTSTATASGSAQPEPADLDDTAKEALRDLSHIEFHLEHSEAPTTIKNRAVDVRLCIKELRAAIKKLASAQASQAAVSEVANDAVDTLGWCKGYVQARLDEGARTSNPIIIEAAEHVLERIENSIRALRTNPATPASKE